MNSIKVIGSNGQVSLGKKYAGRTVMLDEIDTGVWVVKLGRFIPDNERWLHRADVLADLDEAVVWAEENPPQETDIEDLATRIV